VREYFIMAILTLLPLSVFANESNAQANGAYLMDNKKYIKSSKPSTSDAKEGEEILRKMGIEIKPEKIVIDKKRVKGFFESIAKTINDTVNKELHQTKKRTKEELGIRVYDDKVVIDLNKTKRLMEGWVGTLEELDKELTRSLKP